MEDGSNVPANIPPDNIEKVSTFTSLSVIYVS